MNTKIKSCWCVVAFVFTMACVGCGSGSELAQVSGVVTMEGAPVPNLSIEFIPIEGRPSLARTNSDGEFTAYYLPKQPGAAPGKHRLSSEFAQGGPDDVKFTRPKRRSNKGTPGGALVLSPSEIEVAPGETHKLELELVESE
jgi:hypothetical protein